MQAGLRDSAKLSAHFILGSAAEGDRDLGVLPHHTLGGTGSLLWSGAITGPLDAPPPTPVLHLNNYSHQ